MATHIHIHGGMRSGKTQRTIDAMAKASREGKKVLPVSKTRDCGCGGHKDNIPADQPGSGNGRFPTGAKDGTADDGAPVNAAWLKLDRLMPDDLQRKADAKGIKAQGKTDIIMALLRAEFTASQIQAWTLFF
jgi:hypothetical protein